MGWFASRRDAPGRRAKALPMDPGRFAGLLAKKRSRVSMPLRSRRADRRRGSAPMCAG